MPESFPRNTGARFKPRRRGLSRSLRRQRRPRAKTRTRAAAPSVKRPPRRSCSSFRKARLKSGPKNRSVKTHPLLVLVMISRASKWFKFGKLYTKTSSVKAEMLAQRKSQRHVNKWSWVLFLQGSWLLSLSLFTLLSDLKSFLQGGATIFLAVQIKTN